MERFFKQAWLTVLNKTLDQQNNCVREETFGTLTTDDSSPNHNNRVIEMNEKIRIRKLTPKECFRLMGFTDKDYQACKDAGISNSQLYKQAGNSIVVSVLEAIFGQMFAGKENAWKEHYNKPLNGKEPTNEATSENRN